MHDRWDPQTKKGIKGAATIKAWVSRPDRATPHSDPPKQLYRKLNRMKFKHLQKAVDQDRSKTFRLSDESDEEPDAEDDDSS